MGSTSSIVTLCSPGGIPPMSTVLLSLESAHNQGRSSTRTCRWPTRGDSFRASLPNTGRRRQFSVRYWIQTMPWGSPSGSGSSTISLGGGSFLTAKYGVWPRTSLALGGAGSASAPVEFWAHTATTPTIATATSTRAMRFIACLLSICVIQPTVGEIQTTSRLRSSWA